MSIEIRLLSPHDEQLFENLDPDVFDGPVQIELVRTFLQDPRHHIVVALNESACIVGMASGFDHVHPDKPPQLFINEVGVAEAYRRRGIARRMLDELIEHGRRIGCTESWVATETDNIAARALYRSVAGREAPETIVMYTFKAECAPVRPRA